MAGKLRAFSQDMHYEYVEEEDCFISRENVKEGTVRVVEGELFYAEKGEKFSEKAIFNPSSNVTSNYEDVVYWRPVSQDHLCE